MPRAKPATPTAFDGDPDYFDAECLFIKARSSRIAGEVSAQLARDAEDGDPAVLRRPGRIPAREERCRVLELRCEEKRIRSEIDARLELYRADPNRPKLGLDALVEQHGLSDEERFVLLAAAVPGFGQKFAEGVLGPLISFYGAVSVQDLIALTDPATAGDWLAARRWFRPTGNLVKSGLLVLGKASGAPGPDSLPALDVRVSMSAWATIVGDPDAATEPNEGNPQVMP